MIYDMYLGKNPASSLFMLTPMSTAEDNPFNPRVVVTDLDDYWTGELEYKNLDQEQTSDIRVWMNRLRGPVGQFWFSDVTHKQRSTWAGTPLVNGSNQDGALLSVKGLTPNIVLRAGDRFQLGDFLYELTSDVQVGSTGLVDLEFLPEIRFIPANNASLITDNPRCKCMLEAKQKAPSTTSKKALLTDFKFKFRESIRD